MVMYSKFRLGTSRSDTITATDEATLILGLGGDDIIFGGAGNDYIYGGAGDDILYGGGGDNVFVLGTDKDVVKDFALGKDKIQIDLEGTESITLESILSAANLRIDKLVVNDYSSNFEDRTDTYIYATSNTDSIADDIVLMVLEDISQDLTAAEFSII